MFWKKKQEDEKEEGEEEEDEEENGLKVPTSVKRSILRAEVIMSTFKFSSVIHFFLSSLFLRKHGRPKTITRQRNSIMKPLRY